MVVVFDQAKELVDCLRREGEVHPVDAYEELRDRLQTDRVDPRRRRPVALRLAVANRQRWLREELREWGIPLFRIPQDWYLPK